MPTNAERDQALGALDALAVERRGALRAIRARARQAVEEGNDALGLELTEEANRLSQARSRLARARQKVLLAQSLADDLAALRQLIGEAREARQRLDRLSEALEAARRFVVVVQRLAGLFA